MLKAVKIKDNVYWVGAVDWTLRNFHGYVTESGSTYNAYLITGEKNILIDTVKAHLFEEMSARIKTVIPLEKLDLLISNHVEMDHSGGIPELLKAVPGLKVLTSPQGVAGLKLHYGEELNCEPAPPGYKLDAGRYRFSFLPTPMVHWPDNMLTYLEEEKILFSNDAFGQHYASSGRFDDEVCLHKALAEAKKYYANIVLPYGKQVRDALAAASKLDIKTIAPSHGIIWRGQIPEILKRYGKWSAYENDGSACIVYDSMWHSTEKMARAAYAGFVRAGIKTRIFDLKCDHISNIMTDVMTAKYLAVGSPTLNNNMLPTAAAFLTYMKGLAPQGKTVFAFGSYGWGGQSVAQVEEIFKELKFETLLPGVRIKYIPGEEELKKIENAIYEKIKK